jgi:hypothetical protein
MWDQFQEGLVKVGVKERKDPFPLRIGTVDDDDYGDEAEEDEDEYGEEE